MTTRSPLPRELIGTTPVMLLTVRWHGREFRFSTHAINLVDAAGVQIPFSGGFELPNFAEESQRSGVTETGPSFSVGVDFPLNVAAWESMGRRLDSATAELAMVLADSYLESNQTWENRFILATGRVTQPVYGHPDEPTSYATFTVEDPVEDGGGMIIPSTAVIDDTTWPNHHESANGAAYPTVLGQPGFTTDTSGSAVTFPGSPAYVVDIGLIGTPVNDLVLIAGHEVAATTITLIDKDGAKQTFNVEHRRDGLGRTVAVVDINSAGIIDNTQTEFWVAWNTGAGRLDDQTGQPITGFGSALLYALGRTRADVDRLAWIARIPEIDRYKIATYVNDPELYAWEYIRDSLLADLPFVEVRKGPAGLFPLVWRSDRALADATPITAGTGLDFYPTGPITTVTPVSEVRNDITLLFAPHGNSNTTEGRARACASPEPDDLRAFQTSHAVLSSNRYGQQSDTVKIETVCEQATGAQLAGDLVRAHAFPQRTQSYASDVSYGWLYLGQEIRLTVEDLNLSAQPAVIIGKRWDGTVWRWLLALDEDPARDGALRAT